MGNEAGFLQYQPSEFNDLDSDQYEVFHGHPERIQDWLDANSVELRDNGGELISAQTLSGYELDDFRALLIENGYLEPIYDVDAGSSHVASSTDASRWTRHIGVTPTSTSLTTTDGNWLQDAQAVMQPLPSIPFSSPDAALSHLKSIFVDDYYAKTLTSLDSLLKPVRYSNPTSGQTATVPNYVRSLMAVFVQGWIQNPQTAMNGLVAALKELGVSSEDLSSLARSCAGTCYKMLSQMLNVPDGVRLQDSTEYKTFRGGLKTSGLTFSPDNRSALESIDEKVLQGIDRLFAQNAGRLADLTETENGIISMLMNWGGVDGTHWLPLADVRDCIVAQQANVHNSMERISVMDDPGDIAHIIKSFEGDVRDVHWIYDQLGIPKNHDGAYLVDEIIERLKMVNVNLVSMTPVLAPLMRDFNVDQKTWDLCLAIAQEKKEIEFQETAFQVLAVGGSIAAVVGVAAVAGPVGAMAAGGVVAAATGGADIYKTQRRLDDVRAANTAHRLTKLPIADDEHLELVEEARDYAVSATVANTLLALAGGALNPALGEFTQVAIPGKTLTQVTLRALLNTSLQGGYGMADGALSAILDPRQTNQGYLDHSHKLSGASGEAPQAMTALVFSAALGGAFGVGSEAVFGSGKFEILCALDGELPTIIDAVTGRILKGFRVSPDGERIVAPDGIEAPLVVEEKPHVVVKAGAPHLEPENSVRQGDTNAVAKTAASNEPTDEEVEILDDDLEEVLVWENEVLAASPSNPRASAIAMPDDLSQRLGRLQIGESTVLGSDFSVTGIDLGKPGIVGQHVKVTRTPEGYKVENISNGSFSIHSADDIIITLENGRMTQDYLGMRQSEMDAKPVLLQDGDVLCLGRGEDAPSFIWHTPEGGPPAKPVLEDAVVGENGLFDPPLKPSTRASTPREREYEAYVAGRIERLQQVYVKRTNGVPEKGWYVLKLDQSNGRAMLIQFEIDLPKLTKAQLVDLMSDSESQVVRYTLLRDIGFPDDLETGARNSNPLPDDRALRYVRNLHDYLTSYEKMTRYNFRQLFRSNLKQSQTGNCFLVSALNSMAKSTEAFEALMRTSISVGDRFYDVRVPLGDPNGQVIRITQEDLKPQPNLGFGKKGLDGKVDSRKFLNPVNGSVGFQVLEAAYIKLLTGGDLDRSIIDEGGLSITVLKKLLGEDAVQMGRLGINKNTDSLRSQRDKVENYLAGFHNGQDVATLSTKQNNDAGGDTKTYEAGGQTLYMSHAYSIEGVKRHYVGDQCVVDKIIVVNPHDTSKKMEFTLDQFVDAFWMIDSVKIDLGVLFKA